MVFVGILTCMVCRALPWVEKKPIADYGILSINSRFFLSFAICMVVAIAVPFASRKNEPLRFR